MAQKEKEELRTPIVGVLGHVDHGKTSLLDKIRGSAVAEGEAGAITQHIGSTVVPLDVIENICEDIAQNIEIPGLLFIDTPGHHAFTTLRSRGGSLADLAILVVDIREGFQPQTKEALRILKEYETPFVVVANKIDKIDGWISERGNFSEKNQSERAKKNLNNSFYSLLGELSDQGFSGDRYDKVDDFTKEIAVVPTSAETGEGIPDLLAVLIGIAQRFLENELTLHATGPGIGTVMEIKEEKGLGTTIDVLLYDGVIQVGDKIVIGGEDPIQTEVRALLKPPELGDIRKEKEFQRVDKSVAADGIKIAAPSLNDVKAGAPLRVISDNIEEIIEDIKDEMDEVDVETEEEGIVVKADTMGSLEALIRILDAPVSKAGEGDVTKRDIVEAQTQEGKYRSVLAFNVNILDDAKKEAEESLVQIFQSQVIYELVEEYEEWSEGLQKERVSKMMDALVFPGKVKILHDHVFRQSNPAVVGVEILNGKLEKGVEIEKNGKKVGIVKGIQKEGEDIDSIENGERASVAIDGPTVGRQIKEGDELYVKVPEKHAEALEKEVYEVLDDNEKEALDEYLQLKREDDIFWGK